MHDTALHLCDRVLPHDTPYRQWVLSFPRPLRLRLAYERDFFVAARRIFLNAVFRWQRRTARKQGITEPLVGAISFTQRFASSLALHPHVHAVLPDGVFVADANGDALRRLSILEPRNDQGDIFQGESGL
jgi:hypothetical protein